MRTALLTALVALAPGTTDAATPDADPVRSVLERATRHHAAPASAAPSLLRLVYLGTADASAVEQSRQPGVPQPGRTQELLLLDPQERRAALDTQAVGSDGTPGLWRHQITPKGVRSTNRKSGLRFESGAAEGALRWRAVAWRLPSLALAELSTSVDRVRSLGRRTVRGTVVDVLAFTPDGSSEIEIFIRPSGEVAGYAHHADRMRGSTRLETWFKPSVPASGLGRVPGGFVLRVGPTVYRDLTLLDARATPRREDAWFEMPPTVESNVRIGALATAAELLFPGVWALRNVGGYNTFLVDVGRRCLAVIDAVASFGGSDLVPIAPRRAPLSDQVVALARATAPDRRLCWVVPTHHHDDHFGGIAGLARAGATVLTTPGNASLARSLLASVPGAKVGMLRETRVFADGPSRMEIRRLEGGLHAEEMLFAYFPEQGAAITADVSDYLTEEKRFLQLFDTAGLRLETIHAVHSARPIPVADLREDLDFSN
jgi:Metallo-beta-lactamase superfamily